MDIKTTTMLTCLLVAFCLLLPPRVAVAMPAGDVPAAEPQAENNNIAEERRATWLETRNLEENFKELVYLSIQELAKEGLLNGEVITGPRQTTDKRGRHQGFCFRKSKSGRFLPYICWKGEGAHDDK